MGRWKDATWFMDRTCAGTDLILGLRPPPLPPSLTYSPFQHQLTKLSKSYTQAMNLTH